MSEDEKLEIWKGKASEAEKENIHNQFGTDIHIYTGKAGVGKSPNQSFLFI